MTSFFINHCHLLRPGFTDTIALCMSTNMGCLSKVQIMAVTDKTECALPDLLSSNAKFCDEHCREEQGSGDVNSVHSESYKSKLNFDQDEAENLLVISDVVIKSPSTGETLYWKSKPGAISLISSCFEKRSRGLLLQHGIPKFIQLEPTRQSLLTKWLLNKFATLSSVIGRLSIPWLFFDNHVVQPITLNFSRFEKMCILMCAYSSCFLIDVLYHGMEEPAIYFVSEETGVMDSYLGDYLSVIKAIQFITLIFCIAFATILLEHIAGKWKRVIEDPFSYWQGIHPVLAFLHNVLMAFVSAICNVNGLAPKHSEKEEINELDIQQHQKSESSGSKEAGIDKNVSRIPSALFMLGAAEKVGIEYRLICYLIV